MFRCQLCGKNSKPYEKAQMFVTETREKEYAQRDGVYSKEGEKFPDPGGIGREIVSEVKIHLNCLDDAIDKYGIVRMKIHDPLHVL